MQAVSAKEQLTQEQREWSGENKYREMEGFPSSRRDDDLRSMPVESSGDSERSQTLEAWHSAAQRTNFGPPNLDRGAQHTEASLGNMMCYKFAGFEVSMHTYTHICDHQ